MATKICSKCQQAKELSEFYKDKHKHDGLTLSCKQCISKVGGVYRERIRNDDGLRQERNNYQKRYRRLNIKKQREYYKLKKREYNRVPAGKYWNMRGRARHSNIDFNLTQKEFVDWFVTQRLQCHYCETDLEFGNGGADKSFSGLTVDRKDNERGYEIENICLACRRCNTVKGSWFTEKEMLEIAGRYLTSKSYI